MKKGILVCIGRGRLKNIGDYIQSIAAMQFAGRDAVRVEREALNTYADGPTKVVMNAWFMHHPKRFPPSADILPLFTSFHVRPAIEGTFFSERTIAYLKDHEPIGCRSTEVVEMMERHGIRAKFSSCVTLTLGKSYRHENANLPPAFVDPRFHMLPRHAKLKALLEFVIGFGRQLPWLVRHARVVLALARKFRVYAYWPYNDLLPVRWMYASEFHRVYSAAFSDDVLLQADYLTHKVRRRDYPTEAALLARADELLRRYAHSPFVVTSRLHCALPCIAIGTPCWVVPPEADVDAGRFGGNEAFMSQLDFDSAGRLKPPGGGKIGLDGAPPVMAAHLPFAEALARQCHAFMQGDGEERPCGRA